MAPKYTDDRLLEDLAELAADLGHTPTAAEMNDRGDHSADTYKRRFGSWNDALRAADLDVNRERNIPLADLLAEIRRLAGELDRVPTAADMNDRGRYSVGTYADRFDSWGEALSGAGYTVRGGGGPTRNVRALRADGPTPVAALPDGGLSTDDRAQGAVAFRLEQRGGDTAVAYLLDEHDEADVLRVFLDENPDLREGSALHNLMQRLGNHGRPWQAAARSVLKEYY